MTDTPAARKRLSTEERQEEIVRVAVDLAADKGVDSVTTQDMAQAMSVTQGAIFRHFASKDDIWYAVIVWVRERLMGVLEKAAAGGKDPLDTLERMFTAHIGFIAQHPAIPRLLFSELLHKKSGRFQELIVGIISGYEARIAGLLQAAQAQGLVRNDLDCTSAAVLYIGMVQGLVLRSNVLDGQQRLQTTAQSTFAVFKAGLVNRS
ncbi:MAG: TetR/AcrR family transcriptional regulator [Rhodoferax sp.]|nr:MAG: TetR/AcrR family transcriptional regulator [Rhodoferax sp.]